MFKKTLLAIIISLTTVGAPIVAVTAEEIPTETVDVVDSSSTSSTENSQETSGETTSNSSTGTSSYSSSSNLSQSIENYQYSSSANNVTELPDVTMDEVSDKITQKAYAIADMVRSVAIPIVIVMAIASTIALIWGALSKRQTVWPGIFGLLTSGIAYTVIAYAPQILQFFASWLWN